MSHIFNPLKYISYIYSKILLAFLPIDLIVTQRESDLGFPWWKIFKWKFKHGISKSINEHISWIMRNLHFEHDCEVLTPH